jgi:hypothetical protein
MSIMKNGGFTPGSVNIDFTQTDGKAIYDTISNGLSKDKLVSISEQASLLTLFDVNGDKKLTTKEITDGYVNILKNTTTPAGMAKFQKDLTTIAKANCFEKWDTPVKPPVDPKDQEYKPTAPQFKTDMANIDYNALTNRQYQSQRNLDLLNAVPKEKRSTSWESEMAFVQSVITNDQNAIATFKKIILT